MKEETKDIPCSCGHDHSHEHNHEHSHGHHHHHEMNLKAAEVEITEEEAYFLLSLAERRYLPVCQFVMGMSDEDDTKMSALSPVFVQSADEDLDTIKEHGALLKTLEEKGLITLDYDYPLSKYGYEEYKQSDAFKHFAESVNEGKNKAGFLYDTAELETGSMALTDQGERVVQQITSDPCLN